MKKLLAVLVIASAFASCGGAGDAASKTDSAITVTADSAKKAIDSTATKVDSTIKAAADTAKAKINAAADSVKKAVKK